MFCRNCGKELTGIPEICVGCGARPLAGNSFCAECGAPTSELAEICVKCGVRLTTARRARARAVTGEESPKSRLVAFLLAFFIGGTGAHRFYMGKTGSAVGMLILCILAIVTYSVGIVVTTVSVVGVLFFAIGVLGFVALGIWVFIDWILILVGSMKDKDGMPITNWQV